MKIGKNDWRPVLVLALVLSACGGGGGGGGSSSPSSVSSSGGTAQQAWEKFALSSNGGLHYLFGNLSLSTSQSGAVAVASSSTFYDDTVSVPESPTSGAQSYTVSYASLSPNLSVPQSTASTRFVVSGTPYVGSFPQQANVSYSGGNVVTQLLAADGKTVVQTYLGTSYTSTTLSGLISASPNEIFADSRLGIITNTINGQSLYNQQSGWQPGSAYLKVVRQYVGDTLLTGDCAAPDTTDTNLTPCSDTIAALEQFFPFTSAADGKTYQIGDGGISTVAGVRAWVANAPLNTATTEYRVYYQRNGAIYSGALIKDGTLLQQVPLGGGSPVGFELAFNSAAIQSIKAAINF